MAKTKAKPKSDLLIETTVKELKYRMRLLSREELREVLIRAEIIDENGNLSKEYICPA